MFGGGEEGRRACQNISFRIYLFTSWIVLMPLSKPWWSFTQRSIQDGLCCRKAEMASATMLEHIYVPALLEGGWYFTSEFLQSSKVQAFISFFSPWCAWFWKYLWKKKCIWLTENYITFTQPLMIPVCECSSNVNKVEVLQCCGCFVFD